MFVRQPQQWECQKTVCFTLRTSKKNCLCITANQAVRPAIPEAQRPPRALAGPRSTRLIGLTGQPGVDLRPGVTPVPVTSR